MAPVAFTYDWYRSFLRDLSAAGYRFRSYDEDPEPGVVLLRHDVDLSPKRALRIARLEGALDVTSTFFFLVGSPMYNPFDGPTREAIRSIGSLGHDVGLHFSTHQYWPASGPPGESALADRVEAERSALGTIVDRPVETVSFHIPPDWVLERRFEAFESTYEPRFFDEIGYVADSNQRWRDEPPEAADLPERVQVLTHPGLWGTVDGGFRERVVAATNDARSRIGEYADDRYLDGGSVDRPARRTRSPRRGPGRPRSS